MLLFGLLACAHKEPSKLVFPHSEVHAVQFHDLSVQKRPGECDAAYRDENMGCMAVCAPPSRIQTYMNVAAQGHRLKEAYNACVQSRIEDRMAAEIYAEQQAKHLKKEVRQGKAQGALGGGIIGVLGTLVVLILL